MDEITKRRIRTAGIYIPLLTGTLSAIGSGSILYSIWAQRSIKLKDPQHRILAMMSIFDIGYSVNKALMFLTYPSGLGVPTFGNNATCALQGFFTQFGYAAGSYNLVLSIYYYSVINRGMKKQEFARVWEKLLHGIVIICHISFAIIGVSIGLFNPTPGFCYIASAPNAWCKTDNTCTRFENSAAWFYEAFAQGWIQLAYVGIVVTNALIYLFVRRQENEMAKYRHRGNVVAEQLSDMKKKSSYARTVFVQSILYVGAFFLSWSWATIFHLVGWTTGVSVPWITLLINTFLPLQGFFNAFIYARPRYIRLKRNNVHLSFTQLIKLVFLPDTSTGPSTSHLTNNGSSSNINGSANESNKFSFVFRSFMSCRNRNERTASYPPVSVPETEEAKTKAITWADSKPIQDADDEEGKDVEGETTNGDQSSAGEEKIEEGGQVNDVDEFLDSPSPPASEQEFSSSR